MKINQCIVAGLFASFFCVSSTYAQFGGLGKKLLDKGNDMVAGGSLNKLLKQPQAITTSFADVDKTNSKPPEFTE